VSRAELLTAGPLSLELVDDDVRAVRFGDQEVLSRIYVGVRTPTWATVPGHVRDRVIASDDGNVRVEVVADHRQDGMAVEVRIHLQLDPAGELTYRAELEALEDFTYNRMGICLLHPGDASAGRPFWARGIDGEISGRLPRLIGPQDIRAGQTQPLFPAFHELELELGEVRTRLRCDGDAFETEDQRNWSDASFKTYSTPAGLGLPHAIRAGDVLTQQVTFTCLGRPRPRRSQPAEIQLGVDGPTGRRLPALGVALPASQAALEALRPAHVRVRLDLREQEATWNVALRDAEEAAQAAGAGLEVALAVEAGSRAALPAAARALAGLATPIHRVLTFPRAGDVTDDAWVREVRGIVGRALPGIPLGAGAEGPFADVNRAMPLASLDLLAWGIDPQVHASDARSIMETPPTQGLAIRTAAAERPEVGFALGPVAIGPGRRLDADLGPAWAVLSVKHQADAGAVAMTFDLEGAGAPGALAALVGYREAELLAATSTDPTRVDLLAVHQDDRTRLLIVNATPAAQAIILSYENTPERRLRLEPYAVEVVDP
jgi:hypothetical protein